MTDGSAGPSPDLEGEFPLAPLSAAGLGSRAGTPWDRVVDALLVLSGVIILLISLAVTFNLISRETLGNTYTWVFEYSEFAIVFIVFLAVAGVARNDGHVRMDIIDEVLPERARLWLTMGTDVFGAVVALLLTVIGVWVTYLNYSAGTTIGLLDTPRWLVIAIVPIGTAVLFVEQVRSARRHSMVRQRTDP